MSHNVRGHTRTVNGRMVTVRSHGREDDGGAADQKKRHAFERRVLAERQQAEAVYDTKKRTPGERQRRKKNGWTRAKAHGRKARRLYRRHKVRAAGHAAMAVGWAAAYGARKAYRAVRKRLARRGR